MGPVIRLLRWVMYLPILFASFSCRTQISFAGWSWPITTCMIGLWLAISWTAGLYIPAAMPILICCLLVSGWIMSWSSLGSVIKHCLLFALSGVKISPSNSTWLVLEDSCAPASNPPPTGGGLLVALWSSMWLLSSSQRCELTVVLVRFTPDCSSVLLCDCLGHATFCFIITIPPL